MSNETIVGLAILKTNWEYLKRDYLTNFVPIVAECLAAGADNAVSLPVLQEQVRLLFGLPLPLNALRGILHRAYKLDYVRKDQGVFVRNKNKCAEVRLLERRDEILAEYQAVAQALADFAAEEHSVAWSAEQAQEALLHFVSSRGVDFLIGSLQRIAAPRLVTQREDFIIGSFIERSRTNASGQFEAIEALAKGRLLVDALYLPDPGHALQKFHKTRVYLDSKFVVYLCGYAGPAREAPCLELLAMLRAFGADLYCFRGTIEEVHGILDASAIAIRPGNRETAYGPTVEFFLSKGMSEADVDLLSAAFPARLSALGIRIDDKPPYERDFNVDESGFEVELLKTIRYAKQKVLVHDVDCVAAIARLRRGRESTHVETSHALFVTTNTGLARAARNFFQKESSEGTVPLCMSDHALGNLLWLKNPTIAPSLPGIRLLADAYAAMDPPVGLWTRYLAEIARLRERGGVTAEEYYLLRYALASKTALIDLTDGSADAFTEGTVVEVLEAARKHLRRDLEGKLAEEKGLRERAELEVRSLVAQSLAREAGLDVLAARIAARIGRIAYVVVMALLVVGSLYSFPWTLPQFSSSAWRYFLAAVQVVLLAYTLFSMDRGTTVREIATRIEHWLAGRIRSVLRRIG